MAGPYRIELLGQIRIVNGDQTAAQVPCGKPGSLLGYLSISRWRHHPREELMELLWPEADPVSGHNRLKQTLSALRRLLEEQHEGCSRILWADRAGIGLSDNVASTDVEDFDVAVRGAATAGSFAEQIRLLDTAARLYRGDFVAGSYEDCVLRERDRLCAARADVLARLTDALERVGELERALACAQRAVQADPLREEVHCSVLRLYLALGRPSDALRHYRELERSLKRELDIEPCPEAKEHFGRAKHWGQTEKPRHKERQSGSETGVPAPMEPVGGAMPLESRFYVVRPSDDAFRLAVAKEDSIVLLKGPRQVGKTSLLARGAQVARSMEARVVSTDLQKLNRDQIASISGFYLACARSIADQLGLGDLPDAAWDARRGANDNFERYLRRSVLGAAQGQLVWCIDEVDRIFPCDYSTEVFGLFRSWHNERSFEPSGPWSRLTLAIAYATEAHLFIRDLNQSPFNVGTRLTLEDFMLEHLADLNRRYDSPLTVAEVARLFENVGGNPYLCQRSLYEIVTGSLSLDAFLARAERDDGPFHDQLRRMLTLISEDADLFECVRAVLDGQSCPSSEAFYRLRSAGVVAGDAAEVRMRCRLYSRYLGERLR